MLEGFYTAAASVAGSLIGLLFVAVSVARDRLQTSSDQPHRIRAAAALTAFTNALSICLFALIENGDIATPTIVIAIIGLMFVIASLLSLVRPRDAHLRDTLFLAVLLATFVMQLVIGTQLAATHDSAGTEQDLGYVVVVCMLVGIARSWELIGGPQIGLIGELRALLGASPSPRFRPPPAWRPWMARWSP